MTFVSSIYIEIGELDLSGEGVSSGEAHLSSSCIGFFSKFKMDISRLLAILSGLGFLFGGCSKLLDNFGKVNSGMFSGKNGESMRTKGFDEVVELAEESFELSKLMIG